MPGVLNFSQAGCVINVPAEIEHKYYDSKQQTSIQCEDGRGGRRTQIKSSQVQCAPKKTDSARPPSSQCEKKLLRKEVNIE